ncbi:fibrillin-1-like [Littorina saxatilis]
MSYNIDECSGKHACPGECINAAGSYQCQCQTPGYRPSSVPTFCEDVDECAENKGGCQDVCVNKWGTYKCRCEQRGLRLAKDNHSCEDVDECKRYKTKVCRHGVCSNTDGSFVCTCKAGFSTATDRSACIDVDECEENNGGCQQVCNNTMGSFHCGCHHGYVLDKSKVMCSDVDECVSDADLCEDTCVNTPGGFTCICTRLGHVLGPDNRTCVACEVLQYFDDSAQACRFCPAHAHATPGKVALSLSDCVCDLGFRGSPADMQECKDVDECGEGYLRCSHTCVNIPGTAFCACPIGYVVDSAGRSCEDLDECREDENGVVKASCNQVCMNTPGSYTCQCRGDGYTLQTNGHTCTDENECKTGAHNCSHKCVNTDGGFVCECRTGYFMDEDTGVCTDVNECFLDQNPCRQLCTNTEGSYECSCYNAGFRLSRDGTSCVDINECMEGDNPCPDICINTVGSFTCDCNRQGYRLAEDSSGCLDIDECDDAEPHGCEQVCVNTPGAFTCDCRVGYRRVGPKGCQACPQGMYRPSTTTRCQRCPARSTTNGTAKASLKDCHCDQGYTGNPGSSKPCNDYDECDMANFGCQHRCVNTVGSAYCTCNAGFVLSRDRKTCNDVDECANGRKGRCHQVCVNTVGGYTCNCTAPYYTLNRNGYSCDDVDECQTGQRHCEHRCVNTLGGARCSCPYGYRVHEDGTSCDDIDECARSNGGCEDVCTNTVGSFECACTKTGFSPSQDNRQCVDINECLNRSLCEGRCENLYGSYRCHCTKPGTTLGPDGHSCQDVDECQNGTHKCDQLCVNTDLSYRCDCFPGFNRQEDVCVECPVGTLRDDSLPSNESCHSCPPNMTTAKTGSTSRKECICKNGYSIYPLLGTNCRDINECAQKNGGCEDKCQNSRGSFTCTCGPGYTLADDNTSCFRSSCPSLSNPSHGRLVPVQCQLTPRVDQNAWLTPGTVCSYRCRRGYKLRGHAYRTCLPNATWTGQPPTCKAKTCSVLKPPTNGYLLPAICRTGPVPFRKRCKFRCGKNFRLRGKSGAKCLANQRWSTDGSSTRCVPVGKTSKKTANEATVTG